jgi:uncharacterized membrane protein YgdD (TMEM256/DUF423 family)
MHPTDLTALRHEGARSQAYRWWWVLGCLNAALAVALGAMASHALKSLLAENQTQHWFALALQYHQWHALGLIAVGLIAQSMPTQKMIHAAGALMQLGMVLFSGLLYLRSVGVTGIWHGLIPVGGASLIAAWLLLMVLVLRHKAQR